MADVLHRAVPAEVEHSARRGKSHHSSKRHEDDVRNNGEDVETFLELVERERPMSASSSTSPGGGQHGRHRSHRHHHSSSGSSSCAKEERRRARRQARSEDASEQHGEGVEGDRVKRRHHRRRHKSDEDGGVGESGSGGDASGTRRHHHRSSRSKRHDQQEADESHHRDHGHRQRRSRRASAAMTTGGESDGGQQQDEATTTAEVDIYDRPKMPAMKYVRGVADDDDGGEGSKAGKIRPGRGGGGGGDQQGSSRRDEERQRRSVSHSTSPQPQVYENFEYVEKNADGEVPLYDNEPAALYDVPRSNRPVLADAAESNNLYQNEAQVTDDGERDYDVPRQANLSAPRPLRDLVPEEYDVPKIRDSLSTIEEEHQDYDVPRAQDEQAQRQHIDFEHKPSHHPPVDDRSSGYRSSSSPSIHSEELYVNEAATSSSAAPLPAAVMDHMQQQDLDSCGSSTGKQSSPEPLMKSRNVAIETTRDNSKSSSSAAAKKTRKGFHHDYLVFDEDGDGGAAEAARERERERAEEIEREIRRRKGVTGTTAARATTTRGERQNNADDRAEVFALRHQQVQFPRFEVPNDDFVAIAEIASTGDGGIELLTPPDSPRPPRAQLSKTPVLPPSSSAIRAGPPKVKTLPDSERFPPTKTSNSPLAKFFKKNDEAEQQEVHGDEKPPSAAAPKDPSKMKDRSVDIYHETVRQRASARTDTLSRDVFRGSKHTKTFGDEFLNAGLAAKPREGFPKKPEPCKPIVAPPSPPFPSSSSPSCSEESGDRSHTVTPASSEVDQHEDGEEMPSVRQLRSRFEAGSSKGLHLSESDSCLLVAEEVVRSSSAKKKPPPATKKRLGGGGGAFLVMSSLTRRSAVAISKSVHALMEGGDQQAGFKEGPTTANVKVNNNVQPTREDERGVDEQSIFAGNNNGVGGIVFGKSGYSKSKHAAALQAIKEANTTTKTDKKRGECKTLAKPSPSLEATPIPLVDPATGKWSAVGFVAKLYALPNLGEEEVAKHSPDAARMEGFLERLPQNKRKPTIWNNWKRQYFVADMGALTAFADATRMSLVEKVDLFGGRVETKDGEDTVLVVVDRRGHSLMLRCPGDLEEAARWRASISLQARQDFSRTFVVPSPVQPHHLSVFTSTLIVDFGGASVRAGVRTTVPSLPQLFFPSAMAVERGNEAGKYFGLDCFSDEVRARSVLSHPMVPSSQVDKYSVDQVALQGILEKIFKDLAVDPCHYEIQLSVPRSLSDRTKQALASMLFEEFNVRAVNMAHQTVFAFYAYNAKSGIMVDLGERMDVVPIVDGYKVQSGVSRSHVGGKELRAKLQHYLLGRNYSLTSTVDGFVTRSATENLAFVAANFDKALDAYAEDPSSVDASVEISPAEGPSSGAPVRGELRLGSERFEAPEGLFKPELWGLDQAGVHVLVLKAIKECSVDVRKEMTQSIFLSGGLSLLPGLRERLECEVGRLTPIQPKVHASPYRYHAAYLGASAHAATDAYQETKVRPSCLEPFKRRLNARILFQVTKEEWLSSGAKLDRYWTM